MSGGAFCCAPGETRTPNLLLSIMLSRRVATVPDSAHYQRTLRNWPTDQFPSNSDETHNNRVVNVSQVKCSYAPIFLHFRDTYRHDAYAENPETRPHRPSPGTPPPRLRSSPHHSVAHPAYGFPGGFHHPCVRHRVRAVVPRPSHPGDCGRPQQLPACCPVQRWDVAPSRPSWGLPSGIQADSARNRGKGALRADDHSNSAGDRPSYVRERATDG